MLEVSADLLIKVVMRPENVMVRLVKGHRHIKKRKETVYVLNISEECERTSVSLVRVVFVGGTFEDAMWHTRALLEEFCQALGEAAKNGNRHALEFFDTGGEPLEVNSHALNSGLIVRIIKELCLKGEARGAVLLKHAA